MDDDTVPLSTKLGRDSVVRPQLLLSLRQRGLYHDGGPKPGSEVQHLLGRSRRPETRAGRAAWPGRLLLMMSFT